jgi:hypothetical protein
MKSSEEVNASEIYCIIIGIFDFEFNSNFVIGVLKVESKLIRNHSFSN